MAPAPSFLSSPTILQLNPIDRWTVFRRLQELAIPCDCRVGQPLQVSIQSPAAVLQLWSVLQHCTGSLPQATAHLENCWQQGG